VKRIIGSQIHGIHPADFNPVPSNFIYIYIFSIDFASDVVRPEVLNEHSVVDGYGPHLPLWQIDEMTVARLRGGGSFPCRKMAVSIVLQVAEEVENKTRETFRLMTSCASGSSSSSPASDDYSVPQPATDS
jgi:hypothetical protein